MIWTQNRLIVVVSLLLTLLYNAQFFTQTLEIYPFVPNNYLFLFSLLLTLTTLNALLLSILSTRWTIKFFMILIVLVSSMTSYFMESYHVIIDEDMIRNILQTNLQESLDLLSWRQLLYLLLLGLLPAYFIYKTPLAFRSTRKESLRRLKLITLLVAITALFIFISYSHYSSFIREHKSLRYMTNPTHWIYSIGNYLAKNLYTKKLEIKREGEDAQIVRKQGQKPKLIILVVGEATRADHFTINGYAKPTTPHMQRRNLINFSNFYSCGTSTALSVPCMFSFYTQASYEHQKGLARENVLDVLQKNNQVSVIWLDNNSDSKGVALRTPYLDYRTNQHNTICIEGECRDEGMLTGLGGYIYDHQDRDILIVLHQMGNHGPAYYKRYPRAFEKFSPVCSTNQLESCSQEAIRNAYDNAVVYTDYFLEKSIRLLEGYRHSHQTALFYLSDHGESLGENGIYLHGLPYFMAPQAQIHIPAFLWADETFRANLPDDINTSERYTHDNLSHTLLGLFDVETKIYDKSLDIFAQ
jgi:lipid A ethanolaminephosphotransferase